MSCSSSLFPCYCFPLRPTYSPQHPILKHCQPTFLPHCERPVSTCIQNNRLGYSSVYQNVVLLHAFIACIGTLHCCLLPLYAVSLLEYIPLCTVNRGKMQSFQSDTTYIFFQWYRLHVSD